MDLKQVGVGWKGHLFDWDGESSGKVASIGGKREPKFRVSLHQAGGDWNVRRGYQAHEKMR